MRGWMAGLLLAGCGGDAGLCGIRDVGKEITGPEAADCGFQTSASARVSCAEEAHAAGTPFRWVSTAQGTDSVVTTVRVGRAGRVLFLRHDSSNADVTAQECVDPSFDGEDVTCGSLQPAQRGFHVCGWNQSDAPELPEPWAGWSAGAR